MATNPYQHPYSDDPEEAQRQREQGRGVSPRPVDPRGPAPITPYGPIVRNGEDLFDQWLNPSPQITTPNGTDPGAGPTATPVANQWTQEADATRQQLQQQAAAPSQVPSQQLYDLLSHRLGQSLEIDRNDPVIRQQADAFGAQQERASRNYLADIAESAGPNANLRGEQRMAAERTGQSVGAFEAELVGRELQTRRDQISDALSLGANLMSEEQRMKLQTQLALIDQAIQQSQFEQRLSLDAETQAAYFDAVRRGLFRPE